jgi:hypothetical protein
MLRFLLSEGAMHVYVYLEELSINSFVRVMGIQAKVPNQT